MLGACEEDGYEYEYEYEDDGEQDGSLDSQAIPDDVVDERRKSVASARSSGGRSSGGGSLLDGEQLRSMQGQSFVVVEVDKVVPVMGALVADCAALLNLSEDDALSLLIQFRWNKDKLVEEFYSSDALLDSTSEQRGAFAEVTCLICYSVVSVEEETIALSCNHRFCSDCFAQYLRVQIDEGPSCITSTCPQHKCKRAVPPSVYQRLIEPDRFQKYNDFVMKNFIGASKSMRYCPAAGCDSIAYAPSTARSIRCKCSCVFCFACGEEAHEPSSCKQLSDWAEKCANESETANWILLNTKKCPSCVSRIEKNQGCNHMSCKICKHEFCWLCLGDWAEHGSATGGFYKCNKYQATGEGDGKGGDNSVAKAKAELERYLHYYQRYHNHDSSAKFAQKQREQADKRTVELQSVAQFAWVDVEFLRQAVEQLIDCRRVLKYSYVMGYFLPDDSKLRNLFEYQQEMLEKNTEKLSELTEETSTARIDRTVIVNLTRVTEKFMSSLLATLVDGDIIDSGDAFNAR